MSKKLYWGLAALIILLLGVTAVLLLHNTDTEPTKVYKGDVDPIKDVEKTEQRDTAAVDTDTTVAEKSTAPSDAATSQKKTEYATELQGYHKEGVEGMYVTHIPRDPDRFAHLPAPPLPPSAEPEDCPEHLKFLPEWIDGVYRGIEPPPANDQFDQFIEEMGETLRNNILEIARDYNPKRPYAEIWDQFIEYEKMYRAYAEWELGYTPVATPAAGRLDWQYEQIWAFPEFAELRISTDQPYGEEDRFSEAVDVAMGYIDQGWNKITLKDGRDFFIKGNSRYEFVYSGVDKDGNNWGTTTRFSRIPPTIDAPTVRIDVYNTSDEELEALMGWDYTINPITLRPLQYGSDHTYIYPRFMEAD